MKTLLILFVILPAVIFAQDVKDGGSVRRADSLRQVRHVGEQGLIIMPGARTLPQGVFAVDVFGMVSYNFLYAVTSSTQIGLFTLIPIPGFEYTITLNAKQNIYESRYFSAAAYGNINFVTGFYMAGGILTFGPVDYNFNAGYLHASRFENGKHDGILLLGAKAKIIRNIYIIGEYSKFKSRRVIDLEDDFKGLWTAGLRFYAGTGCLELGVTVPLEIDPSVIMPVIKGLLYF